MESVMKGFIVTGTDTDVGKTVFAAGLAQALRAAYWKPVQAGLEDETDSQKVARLAPDAEVLPEAFRFRTPCSPHHAALVDGTEVQDSYLHLPASDRPLVVEGAGGLMVPWRQDLLGADVFQRWDLPVIVCARTTLGTINHTLLTLNAMTTYDLELAGIVLIGDEEPVAEKAIADFGGGPIIGRLPFLDPLDAQTLAEAFAQNIKLDLLDG